MGDRAQILSSCQRYSVSHCTIFASFYFVFEGNNYNYMNIILVKLNPSLVLALSLPPATGEHLWKEVVTLRLVSYRPASRF